MGRARRKASRAEYCGHLGLLAEAQFHHQMAAGLEQPTHLSRNGAVAAKPVGTAVERTVRIVADLRRKVRDIAAHHIGRIGYDHVERSAERRSKVAGDEAGAAVELEPPRIVARSLERFQADVG